MAADPSLTNVPSPEPARDAAGNTAPAAPAQAPRVRKEDMGKYIRTYAKDVARLTNQPEPAPATAASPEPPAVPAATPTPHAPPTGPAGTATLGQQTHDGVTFTEMDASPVNRSDGAPREFKREAVDLTKSDSDGIFAGSGSPSMSGLGAMSAPPPAHSEDSQREAILARLRDKLAGSQEQAAPAPTPAAVPDLPPLSTPTPASPPPPSLPPLPPIQHPEPAIDPNWQPPAPPQPAPTLPPEPPPLPPVSKEPTGPEPLHTFSSDFSDRIDERQASTFSVLAAQEDAGQRKAAPKAAPRSLVPVILAVLLIVLGSGGLLAAYLFLDTGTEPQQTLGVPSLIFADEKMELEGPDYRQALADAANEPLVEGNVLVTYLTSASSTALGLEEPQPGGMLIRELDLEAPDILLRNVDIMSTVGIVHAGMETRPFFVLRVNSYERTFAGMLGWEQRMLDDLAPLYPPYADLAPTSSADTTTGTATGSTTIAIQSPVPAGPAPTEFTDIVVENRDARALKDRFGRTLVLYGYADKQTLIIARDEAAFTALVARLASTVPDASGE